MSRVIIQINGLNNVILCCPFNIIKCSIFIITEGEGVSNKEILRSECRERPPFRSQLQCAKMGNGTQAVPLYNKVSRTKGNSML